MNIKKSGLILILLLAWLIPGIPATADNSRADDHPLTIRTPAVAESGFRVVNTAPAAHRVDVEAGTVINVNFSANIDTGSVDRNSFVVNGSFSGRVEGDFGFHGSEVEFVPRTDFQTGEKVTVALTGAIRSTGNESLVPFNWQFSIRARGGYAAFPPAINFNPSDYSSVIALGDMDGDGDLDIVSGSEYSNCILLNNGDGTGWSRKAFGASPSKTRAVALGDMDGDGDLDIVEGNTGKAHRIYLNNGSATGWTGVDFGTGSGYLTTLAIGDLDRDGDLDIVEGNNSAVSLIYLNDGSGTGWTTGHYEDQPKGPDLVELGDLDNDGDLDIVKANYGQNAVYLNNGEGTDWNEVYFGTGNDITNSLAVGDIDGDGDLDIVTGNRLDQASQSVIYLNDGSGTLWTGVYFGSGSGYTLALGDMEGDGDLDIVDGGTLYLNQASGTEWTPVFFRGNYYSRSSVLGDLDDDGDLDIVVGSDAPNNLVFLNQPYPEIRVEGNSREILNGDTTPDTIDNTDFGAVNVREESPERTFTIYNSGNPELKLDGAPRVELSGANPTAFSVVTQPESEVPAGGSTAFSLRFIPYKPGRLWATVSIQNDDADENPYTFTIQGTGDGGMSLVSISPTANDFDLPVDSVIKARFSRDIDEFTVDKHSFCVTGSFSGGINGSYQVTGDSVEFVPTHPFKAGETISVTLTNDIMSLDGKTLSFTYTWQFTTKVTTYDINYAREYTFGPDNSLNLASSLGDLDGDGDLDIVVGRENQMNGVYLNDGSGTTWSGVEFGPGSDNTRAVALGDVDRDGDLDIVTGNFMQPNVIYLNDGAAAFETIVCFGTGNDNTRAVVLEDLNGDGFLDIVTGNQNQQNVIYLNDGDGTFDTVRYNFGNGDHNTYSLAVGDIDGDGDLDIAEGNFWNPITLYFNNGMGTEWLPVDVQQSKYETMSIHLVDLNNDQALDIALACRDRQNMNFINDGTGGGWEYEALSCGGGGDNTQTTAVGDINGDGYPDIVEANNGFENDFFLKDRSQVVFNTQIFFGEPGGKSVTLALGDLNNDGSLDIVEGCWGQPERVYLNGPGSEMRVLEGAREIANYAEFEGMPGAGDYYNFGSAAVNGETLERTFTIQNRGEGELILFDKPLIRIDGCNDADFAVVALPQTRIEAGGSTTFTLQFDPSVSGDRIATAAVVATNDNDNSFFCFFIKGRGGSSSSDIKPSGKICFTSERETATEPKIYVMGADGDSPVKLSGSLSANDLPAADYTPSCSPDGTRVVFYSLRNENAEIYVSDMQGSLTRLTTDSGEDAWPVWSPDGEKIAFSSNRDGNWEIYLMNSDGSAPTRLTENEAIDIYPRWLSDGRLAFNSDRDGFERVYIMESDGSNTQVFEGPPGVWSPDGSRLAYTVYIDGNLEIYVADADGSNPARITCNSANDYSPAWSPNNRYLAFVSDRNGNYDIFITSLDGSVQLQVTDDPAGDYSPSWTIGDWPTTTSKPSTGSGGGGGGGGSSTLRISLLGLNSPNTLRINQSGHIQSNAQLKSTDGRVNLGINNQTRLRTSSGSPLATITMTDISEPPAPPTNHSILKACNFGPEGATFEPEITLTFSYNREDIPEGASENDLCVGWYDGSQWQNLESTLDNQTRTVSVKTSHFSSYALIARTGEVAEAPVSGDPVQPDATAIVPATSTPAETWRESESTPVSSAGSSPTKSLPAETAAPGPAGETAAVTEQVSTAPAIPTVAADAQSSRSAGEEHRSSSPALWIVSILAGLVIVTLVIVIIRLRRKTSILPPG